MSATLLRSASPHTRFSRRLRAAVVARQFENLAASPAARLLPAAPATTGRSGWAATRFVPAALGLRVFAALATLLGGGAAGTASAQMNEDHDCSQAAARQSSLASALSNTSTEGGGFGHGGRASDAVAVSMLGGTGAAGGTAGKPESPGTGRVTRDRRGLVDAWPQVHISSSCASRTVPGSPMAAIMRATMRTRKNDDGEF